MYLVATQLITKNIPRRIYGPTALFSFFLTIHKIQIRRKKKKNRKCLVGFLMTKVSC